MIDTHAHVVAEDKTRYPLRPFEAEAVDESLKQAAVWHQAAQISAPEGPERLMWGSDFPATHERDYGAYTDFGRACVSGFSESERDRVLTGTALSLWPALRGYL